MAIRITEDGVVNYENSPDVNRKLFPNLNICGKEIDELAKEIDEKAPVVFSSASGSIASFSGGADGMPLKSCAVSIEPIQEGSGNPSPDNVRPISGRTGLSVVRSGKNLLPPTVPSNIIAGTFSTTSTNIVSATNARIFAIPVPKNTDIFVQKIDGDAYSGGVALCDTGSIAVGTPIANPLPFTGLINAPINTGDHGWLCIATSSQQYTEDWWTTRELMISVGTTRQEYVAPSGYSEVSVNWETEAGTVYGGSVDIVSGKLTVDRVSITYVGDSSENWRWDSTNSRGYIEVTDCAITASRTPVICNIGKYAATGVNVGDVFISSQNNSLYYVPPATVTDLTAFKEFLAETNMQVVYKLAEPIEYQLESQEITTLFGINNIWSNGGNVSVESPADTKTYIDDLSIKTVEVSGQTPVITAETNTRYICGEVTSLTFTPCASGICDVRFTSASISTVLTLPQTLKLPDWFDPTLLEAGKTYELNVLDGIYGVVMSWA